MRGYAIELEIFEGNGGQLRADGTHPTWQRKAFVPGCMEFSSGQKFRYPEELGRVCPWLVDSLTGMMRVLENGGTLFGNTKDPL